MGITFGGFPCSDPGTLFEHCRENDWPVDFWLDRGPNIFVCRLGIDKDDKGREPGYGWLLLNGEDLQKLDLNEPHDLTFDIKAEDPEPAQSVTLKNLYVVKTTCLTPGVTQDKAATYLLELTDRRALLRMTAINRAYNVKVGGVVMPPSMFKPSANAQPQPWTWQGMLADIWQQLHILDPLPELPELPKEDPEGFEFYGISAWDALSTVLHKLDWGLVLDPVKDQFRIVALGQSDPLFDQALRKLDTERIWDLEHEHANPVVPHQPGRVKVLFLIDPCVDQPGKSPFFEIEVKARDLGINDPGMWQDGVVILHDDLRAGGGSNAEKKSPANEKALKDRARERAAAYYQNLRGFQHPPIDKTYTGIQDAEGIRPSSKVLGICWYDRGGETGYKTEVLRGTIERKDFVPHKSGELWGRIVGDFGTLAQAAVLVDMDESQLTLPILNTGLFPEASEQAPLWLILGGTETVKCIKTPPGRAKIKEPQVWTVLRGQHGSRHTWHRKGTSIEMLTMPYAFVEVIQKKPGVWEDLKDGRRTIPTYKGKALVKLEMPCYEERSWQRVPTDGSVIVKLKPGFDVEPTEAPPGQPPYYIFSYWPQREKGFWAEIIAEGPPIAGSVLQIDMPENIAGSGDICEVDSTDCFQLITPSVIVIDGEWMGVSWTDPPNKMDKVFPRKFGVVRGLFLPLGTKVPNHIKGTHVISGTRSYGFAELAQDVAGNFQYLKGGRQCRIGSVVLNDYALPGARSPNPLPPPELGTKWQHFVPPGWDKDDRCVKMIPNLYDEGFSGFVCDEGHGDHAHDAPPSKPPEFAGLGYRDWNSPGATPLDRYSVVDKDNLEQRRPPAYDVKGWPVPMGARVWMEPGYRSTPTKRRDGTDGPTAPDYYLFNWWLKLDAPEQVGQPTFEFPTTTITNDITDAGPRRQSGPRYYFPRRYSLYPTCWHNFLIPWGAKWEFAPAGVVCISGFRFGNVAKGINQTYPQDWPKDKPRQGTADAPGPMLRIYNDGKGFRPIDPKKRKGLTVKEAIAQNRIQDYDPKTDPERADDDTDADKLQDVEVGTATPKGNGSQTAADADPSDNVPDPYLDPATLDDYLPQDGQQLTIHNRGPGYLVLTDAGNLCQCYLLALEAKKKRKLTEAERLAELDKRATAKKKAAATDGYQSTTSGSYSGYAIQTADEQDIIIKPCETVILEYTTRPCKPPPKKPDEPETGDQPKTTGGQTTPQQPKDSPGRWTLDSSQQATPKDCRIAYRCMDGTTGQPSQGTGTITRAATTVTGSGTQFLSQTLVGDTIKSSSGTVNGTIQTITSNTSLTTSDSGTLSSGEPYTITPRTSAITGTGTAAQSGYTVTGTGSKFLSECAPGDVMLSTNGIAGRIQRISTDTQLFLDSSATVAGGAYTVGPAEGLPGAGTITQTGKTITGVGTKFLTEVQVGDSLQRLGVKVVVTEITSDTSLKVDTFKTYTTPSTYTVVTSFPRQYQVLRVQDVGAPNGIMGLGRNGKALLSMLANGIPSATTFLRGDGVFAVPSGLGGDMLAVPVFSDIEVSGDTVLTFLANGLAWNHVTGSSCTLTLYDPTTLSDEFTFIGFRIDKSFTGVCKITTPAGTIVGDGGTGVSRYYSAGDVVTLYANGTDWVLIGKQRVADAAGRVTMRF